MDRPLLDGFSDEANGARRLGGRRMTVTAPPKTNVEPKNVKVTVKNVNGQNASLDLRETAETSAAEVKALIDNGQAGLKTADLEVGADLSMEGDDLDDIVERLRSAAFGFEAFLREYHAHAPQTNRDRASTEREVANEFVENMSAALASRPKLERNMSTMLLADFSSAQALLEDGVESYVKAVRKVLKTNQTDAVTISFRDLEYEAKTPVISRVDGYDTFAQQLSRVLCGCCMFAGRAVRNTVMGRPPIEYNEVPILKKMSGVLKAGRLTLVLSPPGAGKTSFLRVLSGLTLGPGNQNTETLGDLRYNQREVTSLKNLAAWVSYTGQEDQHQPLLTVRETLNFAFQCRKAAFYDDQKTMDEIRMNTGQAAVNRVKALKEIEVDVALSLLGLSRASETIIGNATLKGVSGGERRRVTLGEMLVTGSQIMCCDEISTGLDSAATFDITAYLRSAAHALNKTIMVALLQPAPEVIDLFDDIVLMAEGHLIYHGPRESVLEFFENMGFRCPANKDLGDFLVEIPTRNGLELQAPASELRELGIPPPPETAAEFAERWEQSEMFKQEMDDLEAMENAPQPNVYDYDKIPERSYLHALWDTAKWCMLLRFRDRVQIVARVFLMLMMGGFNGSLYYQLSIDDSMNKTMLLVMSLMLLSLTGIPMTQIMSKQRPIFYKHVDAKFYSSSQLCLAQSVVYVPFVCFDVACFGAVTYWLCGLAPYAYSFTMFVAVCISYALAMNTIMMTFPFMSTDENAAVVMGLFTTIISTLSSGALTSEPNIPAAFRWLMWINPLAWSFRALAINEYHTEQYDTGLFCKFEIVSIKLTIPGNCRDYFLEMLDVRADDEYVAGAIVVSWVFVILFLFIQTWALRSLRYEPEKAGAVSDEVASKKGSKTDAQNAYEHDKYLDAVSPRGMQDLASLSLISPLGIGGSAAVGNGNGAGAQNVSMRFNGADSQSPSSLQLVQTPPKTLLIHDLWYTIPIHGEPIDFLKGVSFYSLPGRMMALMGSSGAGKTTLMDTIAGRKTVGYSRGDILVNGEPKIQYQFVKYTGYVEQFGVHSDCATVRESLEFSAILRLPSGTSDKVIQNYVDYVLDLLELADIEKALAGTLSMEQNKRLTLGVELVANPSIIFCDEPTSGLDARAAAIVMRVLLKVARSGRTVVATIHQPSTVIFNFFDDLLLLKRGGEVVYFGELGENSQTMVKYFSSIPGTPPCPKGYNPATWMLEIIGAGTAADATQKDYAAIYKQTSLCKNQQIKLDELTEGFLSKNGAGDMGGFASIANEGLISPGGRMTTIDHAAEAETMRNLKKTYVRGQVTQLWMLLKRNQQTYWRSPQFSLNRLLVITAFTLIFSGFFFDNQLRVMSDLEGSVMCVLFFNMLACIYNVLVLVPFALSRRALYYRERSANMYSVWAFNWGEGLIEIPWLILQVFVTVPLLYFVTNLNTNSVEPFLYFLLMTFLQLYLMTAIALLSASLVADPMGATLGAIGVTMPLMQFSGVMPQRKDIPTYYLPFYYASFYRFAFEGLMSTQYHGDDRIVCLPKGKPFHWNGTFPQIVHWLFPNVTITDAICTNTGTFDFRHPIDSAKGLSGLQFPAEKLILDQMLPEFDYDNRWTDLWVMFGWIVGVRACTFVAMYFVNHNKR